MDVNDEQTEFTFAVRDGVTWSDGTPLNANDFEWSWKRVLDPETKSEYTTALYPLKNAAAIDAGDMDLDELGVKATDEKTLVVTLEGPTPYFPLLAATWTYYPVPRHTVEEYGDAWVEAGNMVSNGPYVLTAWEHDQSMTLERNEKYYGEAPTITRADYTLFADPVTQALVAFENNELDQAQVAGADLERVKSDADLSPLMQVFPTIGDPIHRLRHHQSADRRRSRAASIGDGHRTRRARQWRAQGRVLPGTDDSAAGYSRLQRGGRAGRGRGESEATSRRCRLSRTVRDSPSCP